MVLTPDVPDLPYKLQNGIKFFELIAEPVKREILPGLYINGWGYNGRRQFAAVGNNEYGQCDVSGWRGIQLHGILTASVS